MIILDLETIPGVSLELAEEMNREEGDAATYAATTPPLAKIVCAGVIINSKKQRVAFTGAEVDIIKKLLPLLADVSNWPLITFGGRRFDLLMVMTAAMRHRIALPRPVLDLISEYRYSREPNHLDMYEILTNFGACKGGLRAWCIGLGLGDPKANGDGSRVAGLFAEGKIDEIASYCLSDCDYTLKLYERWCDRGREAVPEKTLFDGALPF